MSKCSICGDPNQVFCNSEVPPTSLCLKCLPKHRESPSHLGKRVTEPAKVPASAAKETTQQPSTPRSRICEAAIAMLQKRMSELEEQVLKEISVKFEATLVALKELEATTISTAMQELQNCREEVERVITSLEMVKYAEHFEPSNAIQERVLTNPPELFLDLIRKLPLASFEVTNVPIPEASSKIFTMHWDEYGFLSDFVRPEWDARLVLIPESPSVLFDITTQTKYRSGIDLSPPTGISMLSLPSGKTFVCGGNLGEFAYMISCDFRSIDRLCVVASKRNSPGLCLYNSVIYLVGGLLPFPSVADKSLFQYNLKSNSAQPLSVKMKKGRFAFTPCLVGDLVYLAGGFAPGIEVFAPLKQKIEMLLVRFDGDSYAVTVAVRSNELLICCNNIYSFHTSHQEDPVLVETTFRGYFSPLMPLYSSGGAWIMLQDLEQGQAQLVCVSPNLEISPAISFPSVLVEPPADFS